MSQVEFNPFTGRLDFVGSSSSTPAATVSYMRVPKKIVIFSDSSFVIESCGATQVFSTPPTTGTGLRVNKRIICQSDSSLRIESNSMATVMGA